MIEYVSGYVSPGIFAPPVPYETVFSETWKTYAGEPDIIAEQLARDVAVCEADTLLLTVPNTLGVNYNIHLLTTIVEHIAPAIGWQRTL